MSVVVFGKDQSVELGLVPVEYYAGYFCVPLWSDGVSVVAWSDGVSTNAVNGDISVTLGPITKPLSGKETISGKLWAEFLDVPVQLNAIASSISGTHVAPTISGSLSQTLDGISQAISGTHVAPTISGSLSQTLDGISQAISGTHVAPTISGSLSQALDGISQTISGTHVAPTISGSLSQALDGISQTISGTHVAPTISGSLSKTLDGISQTISGTHVAPTISGSLSKALGPVGVAPPTAYSPTSWFDVASGASQTGLFDSSSAVASQLSFGLSANSPTLLDAISPSVRFTGTSSYIAGSATTALDSAIQFDYRIAIALVDWTPSGNMVLLSKGLSAAVNGHSTLQVLTGGQLRLTWSDGVGLASPTSSVATGFADGSLWAVRATWDKALGQAKFFTKATTYATAAADVASNSGWTQLGTTSTGNTRSVWAITTGFGIGSYYNGGNLSQAGTNVVAAQMASVIDGSPSITFNASHCGQTGYVDPISGSTYSIARSTSGIKTAVVQSPTILVGTDDYASSTTTPALGASDPCTIASLIRPWATQAAGNVVVTTRDASSTKGVQVELAGTTSVRVVLSDGTSSVTTSSVSITPGALNLVGAIVTPTTVRAFSVTPSGVNLGATSLRTGNDETGTSLRFGNSANLAAGTDLDAESPMPVATFATALSSSDLSIIYSYYNGPTVSGSQTISGSVAVSLGDSTITSSGSQAISGSIAVSLGDSTITSSGSQTISGSVAVSLDDSTITSSGFEYFQGSISELLGDIQCIAPGSLDISGQFTSTIGCTTAIVGIERLSGIVSAAIDDPSISASGDQIFVGNLSGSLGGVSVSSGGGVAVDGSLASQLEGGSASASGTFVAPVIAGTLSGQLDNALASSAGQQGIAGQSQNQLASLTGNFSGLLTNSGNVVISLGPLLVAISGSALVPSLLEVELVATDSVRAILATTDQCSISINVWDLPSRTVDHLDDTSVIIESTDFPSRLLVAANQK